MLKTDVIRTQKTVCKEWPNVTVFQKIMASFFVMFYQATTFNPNKILTAVKE